MECFVSFFCESRDREVAILPPERKAFCFLRLSRQFFLFRRVYCARAFRGLAVGLPVNGSEVEGSISQPGGTGAS